MARFSLLYAMDMNRSYSPSVSSSEYIADDAALDKAEEPSWRGAGAVTLDSEKERAQEGLGGAAPSSHSPTMNMAIESSSSDSV